MNAFLRILVLALVTAVMTCGLTWADEALQYKLGAGDKVRINVFGHPDLSGEFEVDGSGSISLPLIGEVRTGTKTARELEREIVLKLQPDYLKNPRVSVQVTTYRLFYIIGEVNKPGGYPYVSGMTAISAIALAEGYTPRARTGRFFLTRASGSANGRIPADHATPVYPGDIIEVPERYF